MRVIDRRNLIDDVRLRVWGHIDLDVIDWLGLRNVDRDVWGGLLGHYNLYVVVVLRFWRENVDGLGCL